MSLALAHAMFLIYSSISEIKIRPLITFEIADRTFQEPDF